MQALGVRCDGEGAGRRSKRDGSCSDSSSSSSSTHSTNEQSGNSCASATCSGNSSSMVEAPVTTGGRWICAGKAQATTRAGALSMKAAAGCPYFDAIVPSGVLTNSHPPYTAPYSRIRSSTDPNGRPWPSAESGPNGAIGRNPQNGPSGDPTNGGDIHGACSFSWFSGSRYMRRCLLAFRTHPAPSCSPICLLVVAYAPDIRGIKHERNETVFFQLLVEQK